MTSDEELMQQALDAIEYMHTEKCDYMRRNNLGNPCTRRKDMTDEEQHLRDVLRQAMAAHHQQIDGQMTKAIATMRDRVMQQDKKEVRRYNAITRARGEKK